MKVTTSKLQNGIEFGIKFNKHLSSVGIVTNNKEVYKRYLIITITLFKWQIQFKKFLEEFKCNLPGYSDEDEGNCILADTGKW